MRSLALAAAALMLAALPAAAQYDPIADFQAKTPSCDANPNAGWIGRASGSSDETMSGNQQAISFVGCFNSQADCQTWLEGATGIIDGRIIENVCEQRTAQ